MVVLVSDVDEIPAKNKVRQLTLGPTLIIFAFTNTFPPNPQPKVRQLALGRAKLAPVTWLAMVWHHYSFNFVSNMRWGDMRANKRYEAPMALTPGALLTTATNDTWRGQKGLTSLRRAVRDHLPGQGANRAPKYHL